MRLVHVIALAGVLAVCGAAQAAFNDDEKPWSYDAFDARSIFPEAEPNNTCPGNPMACGDVINPAAISPAGDVDYFEFSTTAGTVLTIGTDAQVSGGPDVDTYVELFPADCTLPRLTFNDDGGPGAFSLISGFAAPYTGLYHIKVRHFSASGTGLYKLFLTCVEPTPPPANDKCEGAIALAPCSTGSLAGDNTFAINDYGLTNLPCTGFTANGKDVVYSVALNAGDTFDVTYTAVADGSIYLITNCADPVGSCVAGADDTVSGQVETFSYVAAASGTYFLIVDSFGTNTGTTWTLTYSITCPPPSGACCREDGSCAVLTAGECAQGGGVYYGDGSVCDPNPCPQPPTGACCIPGVVCIVVTQSYCLANGGTYYGDGSTCDPDPCAPRVGACCLQNGSCVETTLADCDQHAGSYQGDGTVCTPNPCPQPVGACCYQDGTCIPYTAEQCAQFGGVYYGDGSVCDPNPCPQPPATGACCYVDGSCAVVTLDECAASQGEYQGDDTVCDPNPCPPPVPTRTVSWGRIKNQHR